jgi:broad specificity phosphatase PhoE
MKHKIVLIRHAVTDWHGENRNLGLNDIPLNEVGRKQAGALADAILNTNVINIISSPLSRARETADILSQRVSAPVSEDKGLIDLRIGEWEGMHHDELVQRRDFQMFVQDPLKNHIPGGEKLVDARARAVDSVERALHGVPNGGCLAIVTHSDIVRLLLTHALGIGAGHYFHLRVSVASVSAISKSENGQRVEFVNWTPKFLG